jgi:prepilin-type N-terminal cleavage/methylation domain-containing protein
MLIALRSILRLSLTAVDGFTLIEMLVAMVAGVIVTGSLLAIIEFSARQESRISDRVQTDRVGRIALNDVLEELRSSCTGFGSTPIQAPSTTPTSPLAATGVSNLWFLSAYGNSTSGAAVVTKMAQHDISWKQTSTNAAGEKLGTLTDYTFTGSGESPTWTFPALLTSNAAAKVLATNVIPLESGTTLFRYYKYNTTPPATAETYGQLVPMSSTTELPPTTTTAKTIAKVEVAFK